MFGTVTLFVVAACAVVLCYVWRKNAGPRVAARVAFVVASCAASSIALEGVLSLRGDVDLYRIEPLGDSPAELYVADPLLKWRYAPHFRGRFTHPEYSGELFETNARGFRDVDWPTAPNPDELRVLVFGDSLTVGLGVNREETFCAILQDDLARQLARPVRVLDAGVAGYGPGEEAILLHELADALRPDLIVAAFYDGNDLEDIRLTVVNTRNARAHSAVLPTEARGQSAFDPSAFLPRSEVMQHTTPFPWQRAFGWRSAQFLQDRTRQLRVRWFDAEPAAVFNDTMLAAMVIDGRSPVLDESSALCAAAIHWMSDRAASVGAGFACLRLPARVQVDAQQWDELVQRLGLDRAKYDVTLPGRALVADLTASGVVALDATSALRAEPGAESSYFTEGHPNRAGHRRIARFLAKALAEAHLLAR